jgi:hypothetical protein
MMNDISEKVFETKCMRNGKEIQKLMELKDYKQLKKYGINFLSKTDRDMNSAIFCGSLLGYYRKENSSIYKLGVFKSASMAAQWLLDPEENCVAVYFDKFRNPKHYGVYRDGKVISKPNGFENDAVFSHTVDSFEDLLDCYVDFFKFPEMTRTAKRF